MVSVSVTVSAETVGQLEFRFQYRTETKIVVSVVHYRGHISIQGQSTQIGAFQMNNFSWLDDIMIKKKVFLKSSDREIWYKTFNLGIHIVLWSQSLHIWKIQWVVLLIFGSHIQMKVKTKTNAFDQFLTEPMLVQKKFIPHMKALILSYFEPKGQGCGIPMGAPRPHSFKNFISFLSEVVEAMWGWWSEKIMFYMKSPYLTIPKIIDFILQCH